MKQFFNYLYKKINNIPAIVILTSVLIIGALGLVHLINYLLTKGIIWVTYELFDVNLYSKFWVVYVGLLLVSMITKGFSYNSKR